eukprot:s2355_g10.t1
MARVTACWGYSSSAELDRLLGRALLAQEELRRRSWRPSALGALDMASADPAAYLGINSREVGFMAWHGRSLNQKFRTMQKSVGKAGFLKPVCQAARCGNKF